VGGPGGGAPSYLIFRSGAVYNSRGALVALGPAGGRGATALTEGGVTQLVVGQKVGAAFGTWSIADAGAAPLPGFARPRGFHFER
jgi:protein-L-isoaspartate(D-aspartate) O-methyltransferase